MSPDAPQSSARDDFAGPWVWLLVAAYVAHGAEEFWAQPSFHGWATALLGVDVTVQLFLVGNALFLSGVIVVTALVLRGRLAAWAVLAVAAVLVANGVFHLVASLLTRSYAPGVITSVVFYVPMGSLALARGAKHLGAPAMWRGVAVGFVIHALVPTGAYFVAASGLF